MSEVDWFSYEDQIFLISVEFYKWAHNAIIFIY